MTGYMYADADDHYGSRVDKWNTSQKDLFKATRVKIPQTANVQTVSFYSHMGEGNVRFSVYKDKKPRTLVWQGPIVANQVTDGWITIPVEDGTPGDLVLPKGDYWVGWEIDTRADVPSLSFGNGGEGFYLPKAFGTTVPDLDQAAFSVYGAYEQSDIKWSMYLTCAASSISARDILDYLLGANPNGIGLDFNFDGRIDLADYIEALAVAG